MQGETSHQKPAVFVLTEEELLGTEDRWRRFGAPVAAGASTKPDGTPDYGIFGPGTVAWEVLLHPATAVFETGAQGTLQVLYRPVPAGVRDGDGVMHKARRGTFTVFDGFHRTQRNSGLHAPMWLGDTNTAKRMAEYLHRIHGHVRGSIIDVSLPELGGYAAAEPRDAMWAAITEMMPILWAYEAFAYHGDTKPHKLSPELRDQYVRDWIPYLRLVGASEEEIPTSMAEVEALFQKYKSLFGHSDTSWVSPEDGVDIAKLMDEMVKRNWHPSHQMAADAMSELVVGPIASLVKASFPEWMQEIVGIGPAERADLAEQLTSSQDWIKWMQRPESESRVQRLMWGPDGVELIENARRLHHEAGGLKVMATRK
ncbi:MULTISPECIES: oxygenase MpaB family protein [unclassified Stenotrophomonas]|nr:MULTISPECIES: oxygenase MpaB family protein [unclassified Stenotrophomonas]